MSERVPKLTPGYFLQIPAISFRVFLLDSQLHSRRSVGRADGVSERLSASQSLVGNLETHFHSQSFSLPDIYIKYVNFKLK